MSVRATNVTARSWWEPRWRYCLYMAACALALFLVASAVQYDLALVVRIAAGALAVVAFVALSIEERHVIRRTDGRVTWGYYVVGLADALAIAVASMWSGAVQRLGFVALGFVLYFLVRSADGLRRAIANRSRTLHAIPGWSIGCVVIAAFWPLPLFVQVGFAALTLVLITAGTCRLKPSPRIMTRSCYGSKSWRPKGPACCDSSRTARRPLSKSGSFSSTS